MNVRADGYVLGDVDGYVIRLHAMLQSYAHDPQAFFGAIARIEDRYGLSASYRQDIIPQELKTRYVKTYFARFNKDGYEAMRRDFNADKDNMELLYVLLIYGFNRMLRFNKNGDFNLPAGNVDLNGNVISALNEYFRFCAQNKVVFCKMDFRQFLHAQNFQSGDFVYLDPPYLISNSEYNKLWSETDEQDLLGALDGLNAKGVKFAVSNLIEDKGQTNTIFEKWAKKYCFHEVSSTYINYHNNARREAHREVLVTNYREETKRGVMPDKVRHGKRSYKQMAMEVAVRNPERYPAILSVFAEHEGEPLDDAHILEIYKDLFVSRAIDSDRLDVDNATEDDIKAFIKVHLKHNNEWGFPTGYQAAFTRYLKTLSELGFIYAQYGEEIRLSPVAKSLLKNELEVSEAFALQCMRFWRKSPYRRVLNDFNYFSFILKVLLKLKENGKSLSYPQFILSLFSDNGDVDGFIALIRSIKLGGDIDAMYRYIAATNSKRPSTITAIPCSESCNSRA